MPTDQLIRDIYIYLQRYFYGRRVNSWDTEELIQEVFCRVLGMDRLDILTEQRYIYRVAHSVLVDRYRADKKHHADIAFDELEEASINSISTLENQDSPEAIAEMQSIGASITNCYNSMPAQRQKVVDLYLYENQSCKAVAAQCGISCSAVEKQVLKGKREIWAEINKSAATAVA